MANRQFEKPLFLKTIIKILVFKQIKIFCSFIRYIKKNYKINNKKLLIL